MAAEIDRQLEAHELWVASVGREGKRLELEDVDLSGVNLAGRVLVEAQLLSVDLDGARLVGTQLGRAYLDQVTLRGANFG